MSTYGHQNMREKVEQYTYKGLKGNVTNVFPIFKHTNILSFTYNLYLSVLNMGFPNLQD